MDKLQKILDLVGVTGNEPTHHVTNFVVPIRDFAILHKDESLEQACELYFEKIKKLNET